MTHTPSRARQAPALPDGYVDGRLFSVAGETITLLTDFDVDAYTRAARGRIRVNPAEVDLSGMDVRDDLAFLWRLDSAALSEARAFLATWTGNEARITAFVATWAYERLWLGHAVRDLLTADGSPLPEPLRRASVRARVRGFYVERGLPFIAPVWTSIVGEAVTVGHMARLAIQERAFQAAYAALLPRLGGEARRVVEEIIGRRDEMIRFFTLEATARITRSPQEARMAKLFLQPSWQPLRIVGVPDPDEARALASVFRTTQDRARLLAADRPIRDLLAIRPTGWSHGASAPTPGLWKKQHRGVRS
ncbi:MAG: hypothetical protein QM708_13725 [Propioniciclava sp.]|uniref:hypothetical protein n=1 Tax=Propioniciclava sp. TaxID=2038686 RepID=UPI0039E68269